MLDNLGQEPSQQEILERIKNIGAEPEPAPTGVNVDDSADDEEYEVVEELEEEAEEVHEEDEEELFYELDGEEVSLNQLKEWKNNGLMQSDYTRKTQALADERKALEAKLSKINEMESQFNDKISALDALLGNEEAEIDWEELAEHDPSEYLRKQRAIEAKRTKLNEAKSIKEKRKQDKMSAESQKLLDSMPAWSDPTVQEKEYSLSLKALGDIGFTTDDLASESMLDHRLYILANKAAKYDELQSKKPTVKKKVAKAPKTVRAVKGKSKGRSSEMDEAKARLSKSGSKQDALAALKLLYK